MPPLTIRDLLVIALTMPIGKRLEFASVWLRFKLMICILLDLYNTIDEIEVVEGELSGIHLVIGHGIFSNWWYSIHKG